MNRAILGGACEQRVQAPTPSATKTEDPTMAQYMGRQFDILIERIGTSLNNIEGHLDHLMGSTPKEATDNQINSPPSCAFAELETKLRIMQAQANWLESLAQRVYRI